MDALQASQGRTALGFFGLLGGFHWLRGLGCIDGFNNFENLGGFQCIAGFGCSRHRWQVVGACYHGFAGLALILIACLACNATTGLGSRLFLRPAGGVCAFGNLTGRKLGQGGR